MDQRYTDQELFDYVVTNMRKQGRPSVSTECCAYRGKGGTKCAAGFLIDDEHYNMTIEGDSAFEVEAYLVASGVAKDQIGLVDALQSAHDEKISWGVEGTHIPSDWMDSFIRKARDVAEYHGLSTDALYRDLPA